MAELPFGSHHSAARDPKCAASAALIVVGKLAFVISCPYQGARL
jgi:hypothetical protein